MKKIGRRKTKKKNISPFLKLQLHTKFLKMGILPIKAHAEDSNQ